MPEEERETLEANLLHDMYEMLRRLQEAKPNERSEKARRYAVTITEFEKVIAYFGIFTIHG